jgi:hypothetical protein
MFTKVAPVTMPFEEFWEKLLTTLETAPEVSNWTAKQGSLTTTTNIPLNAVSPRAQPSRRALPPHLPRPIKTHEPEQP